MSALTRINATIPKPLGEFAERRIKSGHFGNKSEYIRHLIRQDQETARQNQIDYLNRRLEKSIESGISNKSPEEIREGLQKTIKRAVASRNK